MLTKGKLLCFTTALLSSLISDSLAQCKNSITKYFSLQHELYRMLWTLTKLMHLIPADPYDNICKSTLYDTDYACPPGTYNQYTGALDPDSCKACDVGKYCKFSGANTIYGTCADGYYCTSSSSFEKPDQTFASLSQVSSYFQTGYGHYCGMGYYCPSNTAYAIECDPGYYCPNYLMTTVSLKCSAGFYCSSKATVPNPTDGLTGNICPIGYYCPQGTMNPLPCPAGTYLSYTGASSVSECISCTPGQYCDQIGAYQPAGYCSAGYYCPSGQSSQSPVEYYCPVGKQCPTGSKDPQKCSPGYFSFSQMSSSCTTCPTGQYCSERNFAQDCDAGYYCPGDDRKIPCPLGTYSTKIGLTSNQCAACDKGKSCHLAGQISSSSSCASGYYCSGGSQSPRPNADSTGVSQGGGMCKPGSVCPSGSQSEVKCPKGKYCKDYAGTGATDSCEAGYYCLEGEKVKNSNICMPGYYCEGGSSTMVACPSGKYSVSFGATKLSDCQDCPSGKYCNTTGLNRVPIDCDAGYYCPSGNTVPNPVQYLCTAGSMCPAGSIFPQVCQPGYYQPNTGQDACLNCPAGYFCEGFNSGTQSSICQAGYYCPANTKFGTQYPCPAGTYNQNSGSNSSSACVSCPVGYYCDLVGQSSYTKKAVLAGYYSNEVGNTSPTKYICPRHTYCPEGSSLPIPCPKGQMTTSGGSLSVSDCVLCHRGYFCNFYTYYSQFNLTTIKTASVSAAEASTYYGTCSAGYICLEGSAVKNPSNTVTGYICPQGYQCKAGAYDKTPCLPGTYQDLEGRNTCKTCPSGYYCKDLAMTTYTICDAGHYCQSGSVRPTPCAAGTYNSKTGSVVSADCIACPQSYYCGTWGLSAPSGLCSAGYICVSKSDTPTPYSKNYTFGGSTNGQCPAGYYCLEGASTPTPCGLGTYNPHYAKSECLLCPIGKYCYGYGLTQPTGKCSEGYLCQQGQTIPDSDDMKCYGSASPKLSDTSICPLNSETKLCTVGYCPEGAVTSFDCSNGYLQDSLTGICKQCSPGVTCINGHQETCTSGKYCSDNSNFPYGRLCPNGTEAINKTGTKSPNECKACPSGQFCLAGQVIDNCTAGYICLYGADSPTPWGKEGAYPCPKGFYCGKGVSIPELCPVGTYTFDEGSMTIEECDYCRAGYYCEYGSIEPKECPDGNYCPLGSQEPTNCSVTRYNPFKLGQSAADCQGCKGGYYCKDTALGNLFGYNTTYKCPYGNYCPVATWRPYPCKAGAYADDTLRFPPAGLSDCLVCPEHYYCPTETGFRFTNPCPSGTYCPAGSAAPILCEPGKYCNATKQGNQTVIVKKICPYGYYCPLGSGEPIACKLSSGEICKIGASFPSITQTASTICSPGYYYAFGSCNLCEPGYVCFHRTNTKFPTSFTNEGGYECPVGYYCPRGSALPTKCPSGTYRSEIKGKTLADCLNCPTGSYNSLSGQISCIKCGRGATNSDDFTACECNGAYRVWRGASDNQCVCQSPFTEPTSTNDEAQTSTDTQDCVPPVEVTCTNVDTEHYDEESKTCLSNDVCKVASLCSGEGLTSGYYSSTSKRCLCSNVVDSASSYCDADCQAKSLKAYLMPSTQICLKVAQSSKCYDQSVFGTSLFLDRVTCSDTQGCLITGVKNSDGNMQGTYEALEMFVKKWKESTSSYISPYGTTSSSSTTSKLRMLQSNNTGSYFDSAIICTKPNVPVSFSVSTEHFPVYVSSSSYNTNPNFDAGVFDQLKIKLLNAGMQITTFMFSFETSGVYVFGDYSSLIYSQTLVKVDANCPTTDNIYPLTESNLNQLGISPQEFQLKKLSSILIIIPILFIVFAFISTILQNSIELRIERKELERRMRRAGRRRAFHNQDGKLDKKQYLSDLYKLIKDNLEEVKKLIDNQTNKDSLYKLLKDKTSLAKELGDNGKQVLDELKSQMAKLLGHLRFPDGRTLKERLMERELEKRLQHDDNENEENAEGDQDSLMNETDLDNQSYGMDDDEDDEDMDNGEDEDLINAASQQFRDSVDGSERHRGKKNKNQKQDPNEIERLVKLKQNQDQRKGEFKDRMLDLIDNEQDRNKIVDGFDEKMRQLDTMLKNESKGQEDSLAAKLALRKNRKRQAQEQLNDRVREKENQLEVLQDERDQMIEDFEEIIDHGMKDPKLQELQEKEKQDALQKLDRQKDEQLQQVRDEYMGRLKGAKSDKEKEKILDEMQRRLASIEDQLNREKLEQEKNLEKILKDRQAKRVKKIAREQEKQINAKDQDIQTLARQIEQEKASIYAEFGGELKEDLLDSKLKEKVQAILKKTAGTSQILELDQNDKDQLDILKVQLNLEKERALKAVEREIDEESEQDHNLLEEKLKNKLQTQRDEFNQRISKAKNEKERKDLIKESKKNEKKIQDEIQNEKLKQERMLEERRMNRQSRRKIKELEIEQRQMEDMAKKEVDLLNRKYQEEFKKQDNTVEKELNNEVQKIEQRAGADAQKEQALLLVNETTDDMLKKRLKMLIDKQFFELQKYLGAMYTQTAMSKLIAKEKIKDKYKNLEEEAYSTMKGEQLLNKINQLKQDQEIETSMTEAQIDQDEKDKEAELRERLEGKFFDEKQQIIQGQSSKKHDHIKSILNRNKDDALLNTIGNQLLTTDAQQSKEELARLDQERKDKLDKIKLQIVADNEAEVQEMSNKIEEQMAREKEAVEQKMKQKRDEIIGDKKKKLEERIQEMKGQLSEYQREQIMKQYQQELDALERAITDERESQLSKMRQKLIKRKIEKERLRKEEEQQKKMLQIKSNLGSFLKNKMLENKNKPASDGTSNKNNVNDGMSLKDKLRLMLQQWNEGVNENKQNLDDPQNIWEKNSQAESLRSSASKMSKMSKMSKITTTTKIGGGINNLSQAMNMQNYTMEELVKRIRRIENLTEKMSSGNIQSTAVKEAQQTLKNLMGGKQ